MSRGLHRYLAVFAALAGMSAAGCVSGSLASDTGPRPAGYAWSQAGRQMVHVGEQVEFDFVLQDWAWSFQAPLGIADYCVVYVGDERIEIGPDIHGHFRFSYAFHDLPAGDAVTIRATPYQTRGSRDFMKIREQWIEGDSPYDQADRAVAFADAIRLLAYRVPVELTIARPANDLDLQSGVLKIRRTDGATTSVFIDKPDRPGFTMSGPEPDGYYRAFYQPRGNELNATGTTDVEFVMYDTLGQRHYASQTLDTP